MMDTVTASFAGNETRKARNTTDSEANGRKGVKLLIELQLFYHKENITGNDRIRQSDAERMEKSEQSVSCSQD